MSLRNQNRKTKNKSTDNKELTYYDKLIHKLKNIPLIAIVILIGVVIIGVATFFKNIREFWNISKSKAENVSDSSKSKPREI
ncbi:MAG: hypothetical protein J0I84_10300, partial [Terrimonas sp.]|nr:hypothetical protein [Terrimonas sp.]